jgi:hypothetical protein
LFVLLSVFAVACGGVDADLKMSSEELEKELASLSVGELKARSEEVDRRAKALEKEMEKREPTESEMKLLVLKIAYEAELACRSDK